jgi:hypothetical protein
MKSVIAVTALALTLFATGAKAQEPPAAQAKVVVYRTNLAGARGGVNVLHSEPKVFIDDVQVGKMPRASVKRGSVLEFSVAPGAHRIYSDELVGGRFHCSRRGGTRGRRARKVRISRSGEISRRRNGSV